VYTCLGSKLFNRYVAYYNAQSVVLSFAADVAAYPIFDGPVHRDVRRRR
jgi:hypothetical protein